MRGQGRSAIFLDQRGFTLVEILIAAGIMSIVMMGMLSINTITNFNQREIYRALNWSDLNSLLLNNLRNETACTDTMTLQNIKLTTAAGGYNIPYIYDASSPAHIVATGNVAGNGGTDYGTGAGALLKVNFALIPAPPPAPPTWTGGSVTTAYIQITYWKVLQNLQQVQITKTIPIQIVPATNSPGPSAVSQCYADLTSTDNQVCNLLGGTYSGGVCTKLAVGGNYGGLNPGALPVGSVCGAGGCVTNFGQQMCPLPGYPANYRVVIGLSKGGTLICGMSTP